jgi:elongation factor 2 kinase
MDVDEEADEFECRPKYEILQKLANLYRHGGFRLDADLALAYDLYNEAAELAMEAMQGKLANKLYMLAEECSSAME